MNNAYDKLTRYCLYRERCTFEVQQKMYELKLDEDASQQLMNQLKEEKYLDDERYVKAYINARIYLKKWGKKKIQAELSLRKLDRTLVKKLLLEVDDPIYIRHLQELAEKKWNTLYKKPDREKQAALLRYLSSKGYEQDLIMDWMKENVYKK